ncbi:Galectin-4, partial [Trichinella murrelli]
LCLCVGVQLSIMESNAGKNKIYTPSVPYAAVIPQGVEKNRTIVVQGLVTSSGHKLLCCSSEKCFSHFAVNLCCGVRTEGDHRDDIALHIDVRFGLENIVVLNSLIQDTWGTEERHRNPCRRGQPFRIKITAFQDRYQMAMNQDLFMEYYHRVPIENIKVLQIEGCVVVDIIEYAYSEAHIVKDYILNHIDEYALAHPKETTVLCPKVPVSVPIKYSKDHFPVIFINAKMVRLPTAFEIDFLAGEDIALRSKFNFDDQIIVRNARVNGKWGVEEQRSYCFPFVPQYHEDFEITCDEKRFAVRAGDLHLYSFLHRIEPYLIDTMRISGDVKIIKIRIKRKFTF